MKTAITAAFLVTAISPALADMIDYGFKFTNQAQAIADATMLVGQYDVSRGWAADHVLANIQCWRPSQDVGSVHTFLAGYFVLVSIDTAAPINVLLNHSALQFALDRNKREAGQAFVVKNNIGAVLADLGCQPMFQSRNPYPVGGFN